MDVLRKINATCTAAGVDLTAYLQFTFKNRVQLHKNPELFTSYAFALELERQTAKSPKA